MVSPSSHRQTVRRCTPIASASDACVCPAASKFLQLIDSWTLSDGSTSSPSLLCLSVTRIIKGTYNHLKPFGMTSRKPTRLQASRVESKSQQLFNQAYERDYSSQNSNSRQETCFAPDNSDDHFFPMSFVAKLCTHHNLLLARTGGFRLFPHERDPFCQ